MIPNSTKIHWRNQNYSYEFGCQAREAHRWLLEHWWLSRLVWSLDRVHTIYSIGSKTSRRIYEVDEKTAYIQARSSITRALEVNGKACQAEGEAKVVWSKAPSWKRTKIARDLFHRPRGYAIQRNARKKLETSVAPAMPCKIMKIVGVVFATIKAKLACILEADECVWEIRYRIIMKTILQEKVRIHHSTTFRFTSLFLCFKLWKFLQQKQRWTRNGKSWTKFRRGTWQKSEVRNRWSMKQGRRAQEFILHH